MVKNCCVLADAVHCLCPTLIQLRAIPKFPTQQTKSGNAVRMRFDATLTHLKPPLHVTLYFTYTQMALPYLGFRALQQCGKQRLSSKQRQQVILPSLHRQPLLSLGFLQLDSTTHCSVAIAVPGTYSTRNTHSATMRLQYFFIFPLSNKCPGPPSTIANSETRTELSQSRAHQSKEMIRHMRSYSGLCRNCTHNKRWKAI